MCHLACRVDCHERSERPHPKPRLRSMGRSDRDGTTAVRRLRGVGHMTAAVIPAIGLSGPRRDMPEVCLVRSAVEIRSALPTPQSPAARRDMWRNPSSEGRGVMKVVLLCASYRMRMRTAQGRPHPQAAADGGARGLRRCGDRRTARHHDRPVVLHCVDVSADGDIKEIAPTATLPIWVHGVYFVLTHEIFDLIPENGDLVGDACMALAGTGRLLGYPSERTTTTSRSAPEQR
jgi:hypothetical protein